MQKKVNPINDSFRKTENSNMRSENQCSKIRFEAVLNTIRSIKNVIAPLDDENFDIYSRVW